MNYRHQFHAGNFADVVKHALLVQLLRGLQQKEKGVLILDTHAGRGAYDLAAAAKGDSLARQPEWPAGIGRLWTEADLGPELAAYVALVRQFDHDRGNRDASPRYYPGSPWIARLQGRVQDRLVACERHPEEHAVLAGEMAAALRTSVQATDGYTAVKACLPPPERRALVLIDPPFEAEDEVRQILAALDEGLRRLPAGVFAIWYPLTERAGAGTLEVSLIEKALPPTLLIELRIAGEASALRMRGCGLVVVNPPWKFAETAEPLVRELARRLAQDSGAGARLRWLVPER